MNTFQLERLRELADEPLLPITTDRDLLLAAHAALTAEIRHRRDHQERLRLLHRDLESKLASLKRALERSIDKREPFGFPNGSLVLEVIQLEARIQELES